MEQANMVNGASLQAINEAISLQKGDLYKFFADLVSTKEKTLLMSSAAPISLKDSDSLQDSDLFRVFRPQRRPSTVEPKILNYTVRV
jgi:hypothetical protein